MKKKEVKGKRQNDNIYIYIKRERFKKRGGTKDNDKGGKKEEEKGEGGK